MARIRSIKPEFFKDDRLYEAERAAALPLRLALTGLWCQADRAGRFRWAPRALKTDVLPYDESDFDAVLAALVKAGYLVRYVEQDGEAYGQVCSWERWQRVPTREPASELPAPSSKSVERAATEALLEQCSSTAEALPEHCSSTASTVEDWDRDRDRDREGIGIGIGKGKEWEGDGVQGKGEPELVAARRPQPLLVDGAPEHAAWVDGQRAPVPPYEEIVEHLNARAGTKHLHTGQATRMLIRTLWLQGYSLDQFKLVIDTRCKAWKNDAKTREWLRPKTLFEPSKFESYLGAIDNSPEMSRTPDETAIRIASRLAITRTDDERRDWIRKQPKPWRRKLAITAGLHDWSEDV